jgi:hypothetical protein
MFTLVDTPHGIFYSSIDKDRGLFCMDFNPTDKKYPDELINHCFEKEKTYLFKLIAYPWAPEIVEVNPNTRRIVFKWYDNPLPENYIEQLTTIAKDLRNEDLYKFSFYPRYFYTDNSGKVKTYCFHTVFEEKEQPMNVDYYRPILNADRAELIDRIATDGKIHASVLIKHAFTDYIEWPNNPLPKIYETVYG